MNNTSGSIFRSVVSNNLGLKYSLISCLEIETRDQYPSKPRRSSMLPQSTLPTHKNLYRTLNDFSNFDQKPHPVRKKMTDPVALSQSDNSSSSFGDEECDIGDDCDDGPGLEGFGDRRITKKNNSFGNFKGKF